MHPHCFRVLLHDHASISLFLSLFSVGSGLQEIHMTFTLANLKKNK